MQPEECQRDERPPGAAQKTFQKDAVQKVLALLRYHSRARPALGLQSDACSYTCLSCYIHSFLWVLSRLLFFYFDAKPETTKSHSYSFWDDLSLDPAVEDSPRTKICFLFNRTGERGSSSRIFSSVHSNNGLELIWSSPQILVMLSLN